MTKVVRRRASIAPSPYYTDGRISLYCGDFRDVLPLLDLSRVSSVVTDPPYGQTSLPWDVWVPCWPAYVARAVPLTASLWTFGNVRLLFDHGEEFTSAGWRYDQDLVWEKHNGSGPSARRFNTVHELIVGFYRGRRADVFFDPIRVPYLGPNKSARRSVDRTAHRNGYRPSEYVDDGTRLLRSVVKSAAVRGKRRHPTEKPLGVLRPLVQSVVPVGGVVLDVFAGSASTLVAARETGRCAIGIEASTEQCEVTAQWLMEHERGFL